MNTARLAGVAVLIVGVALLIFSFYNAYMLFIAPKDFEAVGTATIQAPTGPVPLEIPGLGSFPKILEALVNAAYLSVMIAAASKIAGKGIDLLKVYR